MGDGQSLGMWAGLVPAGLYGGDGRATAGLDQHGYTTTVHRVMPVGLTERARRVLQAEPDRVFSLRDLADALGIDKPLWELNASLVKLVRREEVEKMLVCAGPRVARRYRWRAQEQGAQAGARRELADA